VLQLLTELVEHKIYANTSLFGVIREHPVAAQDVELRTLLHHIIVSNRFWLFLLLDRPFVRSQETARPDSLNVVDALYAETHALEREWLARVDENELASMVAWPRRPEVRFTVAQVMSQVCLHSQGHRAQCATRLRSLGGAPPTLDFIHWLAERAGGRVPAEAE
jgi:uncharacterized damage-inducible protein DinB